MTHSTDDGISPLRRLDADIRDLLEIAARPDYARKEPREHWVATKLRQIAERYLPDTRPSTKPIPAQPGLVEELERMVFAPSSIIDDYASTITMTQHKRILAALRSAEPGEEMVEESWKPLDQCDGPEEIALYWRLQAEHARRQLASLRSAEPGEGEP